MFGNIIVCSIDVEDLVDKQWMEMVRRVGGVEAGAVGEGSGGLEVEEVVDVPSLQRLEVSEGDPRKW